ncbi:MAG: adenylate/guanylate cyclase domain-containing protein [Gammaproteobacteria bacterium]|nr:adenylate/guanylate cyclase domain-containing protein [Gammaproteobacteria bacterium]MDP2139734.1 adenylate/guanylate cyclase domain-containing protein [Gammaproteobacteria bacterium]MDP2348937.1 adenylate/guanylate cyclase domain-containing protein [Gammaproteobacteria bacterium]
MQKPSSVKQLSGPLAHLVRLAPIGARLLMLAAAALLSLALVTVFDDALQTIEERLGALGWTLNSDTSPEQRITIIAIDEKSLAQEGPFPWPRETMARLVTALNEAGVQLQLHDVVYPEASAGDDALLAALRAAPGAVLAQVPVLQSGQAVRTGLMTHALSGVSCSDSGAALGQTGSFLGNNATFAEIPKGHITPIVAGDGAIREVPAVICVDGNAYPALAISAFLQAVNSPAWGATIEEGSTLFGPDQLMQLNAYPGLRIPLDDAGNMRISYRNAPEAYQAISAADVLNGDHDADMLENAWVLVGATAFGIGDIVPTPYSGATPGVELQARMLTSLLDTAVPYTPAAATTLLVLLSGLFAVILFVLASARERFASYGLPAAGVLLPVFALALHVQLLGSSDIWLGWVGPAVYGLCAASFLMLLEQARVRHERGRVFGNLNSYLPSDVAREIAYSLPSSSINAKRSEVTLLSADLRNFSAFGEARPPEESAALLHYFFVRATEIVEEHHGRIHEFKGDSLLAVWDGHDAQAAAQALLAAQEMQASINKDMPQNPPEGLEPLALGIGIEQGPVLIGSIGPAQRRTHTLLGDTVTITLRIQEMTAELAQPILVGECAARQLADQKLESQGSYLLSGLRIPHTLFSPSLSDTTPRRSRQDQVALTVVSGGRR